MSDVHATVSERLAVDTARYTLGRRAIVTALEASTGPLSINDLLEECAGLVQSSAYRNLSVLERAGVVRRLVGLDEFTRYELAEDLTEHHHHLACSRCGRVEDFTLPETLEADLEAYLDTIAGEHGFTDVSHALDLVGTCRTCSDADSGVTGPGVTG